MTVVLYCKLIKNNTTCLKIVTVDMQLNNYSVLTVLQCTETHHAVML